MKNMVADARAGMMAAKVVVGQTIHGGSHVHDVLLKILKVKPSALTNPKIATRVLTKLAKMPNMTHELLRDGVDFFADGVKSARIHGRYMSGPTVTHPAHLGPVADTAISVVKRALGALPK